MGTATGCCPLQSCTASAVSKSNAVITASRNQAAGVRRESDTRNVFWYASERAATFCQLLYPRLNGLISVPEPNGWHPIEGDTSNAMYVPSKI